MRPMKVKNGIASSVSLRMMPNTRSGNACSNSGFRRPRSIARRPKRRPLAASENATG